MRNRDITFTPQGVLLSPETYAELRQFALQHGETDLPAVPEPAPVVEKSSAKPPRPKEE